MELDFYQKILSRPLRLIRQVMQQLPDHCLMTTRILFPHMIRKNDLPDRPCSAFLNPHVCFTLDEFFASLQLAQVDPQTISCVQRQSNGEVVVTFRGVSQRDAFLAKSVLQINGQPFALQDIDRPLTYLQIFDCPYEMPDSTIINCLEKYCEVVHHRRGYFAQGFKHIQTGVRHYRVRINHPIPNFMRFGRIVINLRYPGQPRTCRHCNQCGHLENSCRELVCFNCEDTGHQAATCPHPVKCNLCKSTEHKARSCPFSWSRKPASSTETSEQLTTAEAPEDQPSTSQFPPEEQPTTAENQPTQVSPPPQDVQPHCPKILLKRLLQTLKVCLFLRQNRPKRSKQPLMSTWLLKTMRTWMALTQ